MDRMVRMDRKCEGRFAFLSVVSWMDKKRLSVFAFSFSRVKGG